MTSNPNQPPEPQDQTSNNQSWNAIDLGLQPLNIFERIMKNFVKAFSFNFGWDYTNNIWRRLSVDSNGNLLSFASEQSSNAPNVNEAVVTNSNTLILAANTNRIGYMIANNDTTENDASSNILITLGDPAFNNPFPIMLGYYYYDDIWQGDVWAVCSSNVSGQFVNIVEYVK